MQRMRLGRGYLVGIWSLLVPKKQDGNCFLKTWLKTGVHKPQGTSWWVYTWVQITSWSGILVMGIFFLMTWCLILMQWRSVTTSCCCKALVTALHHQPLRNNLVFPCQHGHQAELAVSAHRLGRSGWLCLGGTVQILIAENRQLAVPGWCTVAPVHGGGGIEMCVAAVRGALFWERTFNWLRGMTSLCVCMCDYTQAHMLICWLEGASSVSWIDSRIT